MILSLDPLGLGYRTKSQDFNQPTSQLGLTRIQGMCWNEKRETERGNIQRNSEAAMMRTGFRQ